MTTTEGTETIVDTAAEGRFAEPLRAVGGRVRNQRRERGISLRELSSRSGLSASFLSLVERGECSLSLTSLFAISEALGSTPAELLDAAANDAATVQEYSVWRSASAGGSPTMTVGEREYFRFPGFEGRTFDPLYFRIHPTSTIAPLSEHEGEEFAYVVRGSLWIQLRDREFTLTTGDAVHFPSTTPHTIANRTTAVTEALWVSTLQSPHGTEPRDA